MCNLSPTANRLIITVPSTIQASSTAGRRGPARISCASYVSTRCQRWAAPIATRSTTAGTPPIRTSRPTRWSWRFLNRVKTIAGKWKLRGGVSWQKLVFGRVNDLLLHILGSFFIGFFFCQEFIPFGKPFMRLDSWFLNSKTLRKN